MKERNKFDLIGQSRNDEVLGKVGLSKFLAFQDENLAFAKGCISGLFLAIPLWILLIELAILIF